MKIDQGFIFLVFRFSVRDLGVAVIVGLIDNYVSKPIEGCASSRLRSHVSAILSSACVGSSEETAPPLHRVIARSFQSARPRPQRSNVDTPSRKSQSPASSSESPRRHIGGGG